MTVADALATLHELVHYDADPVYDLAPAIEALAVVKEEIVRLNKKLAEGWDEVVAKDKARAIKAEIRAEDAKAEVVRLRDGLRRIVGPNPNYDPDGQHDYGWENEPPRPFAPAWVRDIANDLLVDRALLAENGASERDEQLRRDGVWRMLHHNLPDDNTWHNLVIRAKRNGDTIDWSDAYVVVKT